VSRGGFRGRVEPVAAVGAGFVTRLLPVRAGQHVDRGAALAVAGFGAGFVVRDGGDGQDRQRQGGRRPAAFGGPRLPVEGGGHEEEVGLGGRGGDESRDRQAAALQGDLELSHRQRRGDREDVQVGGGEEG